MKELTHEEELDLMYDFDCDLKTLLSKYDDKGLTTPYSSLTMIITSVSRMLYSAPNELEGVKDINEMINEGIKHYEAIYS